MQTFFNTVGLSPGDVVSARQQASGQQAIVRRIFADKPALKATPSQIHQWAISQKLLDKKTPITSVRRAISNLCKARQLIKLPQTKPGPLGRPEYLYQINPTPYEI